MARSEETDLVAKDAAISSNHPRTSVKATPKMIAIGALRCAPATSSEMCAAESSDTHQKQAHVEEVNAYSLSASTLVL